MNASDLITLTGLVIAFIIFLSMAAKEIRRTGSAAVRNLKFQLAIATFVWLVGESLSIIYAIVYGSYEEFLEIHTLSMGIFALIILTRLPQLLKRTH
jgi:cytochrome c biogenesis protein CcdA